MPAMAKGLSMDDEYIFYLIIKQIFIEAMASLT
jgi:hypothetical protein